MRMKFLIGTVLVVGALAASTLGAVPTRKSAIVRFLRPTIVAGTFIMGTVVFEHDDEKMARGEPCTTVYHYDADTNGPGEPILAFMCLPRERPLATKFEATLLQTVSWPDRLTEYQITGEREGHGVPNWK
jgi:hypothetical protein